LLRVTAAPRIKFHANPLAAKGESRATASPRQSRMVVTKMTQATFVESDSRDLRVTDSAG
jgi:hypothetical protein